MQGIFHGLDAQAGAGATDRCCRGRVTGCSCREPDAAIVRSPATSPVASSRTAGGGEGRIPGPALVGIAHDRVLPAAAGDTPHDQCDQCSGEEAQHVC